MLYEVITLFYLILLLATGAVFLGMIPSITIVPTLPAWIILLAGMGLLMASVCNMTKTKLIAQSLLFPVCLIPVSTYILHQAGTDINAITPVVNYLEAVITSYSIHYTKLYERRL